VRSHVVDGRDVGDWVSLDRDDVGVEAGRELTLAPREVARRGGAVGRGG
jgi:hypothetical protein